MLLKNKKNWMYLCKSIQISNFDQIRKKLRIFAKHFELEKCLNLWFDNLMLVSSSKINHTEH